MNNQELISRLREAGQALETLAQHLNSLEDIAADIDIDSEIESDIDSDADSETDIDEASAKNDNNIKNNAKPQAAANNSFNPFAKLLGGVMTKPAANPFQLLSSLSSFAGLGGLNGIGSLGGINSIGAGSPLGAIGGQSLPTTLAELHDNPQLLAMLRSVANNPQMLNMLSGITGQDSQTLLRALQSLQPQAAAADTGNAVIADTEIAAEAKAELAAEAPAEEITSSQNKIQNKIQEANTESQAQAQAEAEPQSLAAFAAELAAKSFEQNQQIQQPMPTAAQTRAAAADIRMTAPQANMQQAAADANYLDSLLAEWHWQPYARVWTLQS